METLKQKIKENLESEKKFKRSRQRTMPVFILFLLLCVLLGVAAAQGFGIRDGAVFFSYKELSRLIVSLLIADVSLLLLLSSRNVVISDKTVKRRAKMLLEKILFLKEKGDFETCYVILSHEAFVRSPEDLDQIISDLKEILGYKNLADGGLHIAES